MTSVGVSGVFLLIGIIFYNLLMSFLKQVSNNTIEVSKYSAGGITQTQNYISKSRAPKKIFLTTARLRQISEDCFSIPDRRGRKILPWASWGCILQGRLHFRNDWMSMIDVSKPRPAKEKAEFWTGSAPSLLFYRLPFTEVEPFTKLWRVAACKSWLTNS